MSTEATIYQTARAGGLPQKLSEFLVFQAQHETGDFTSNFFKKYNNAFGYSYSGSKYQTGRGTVADNGVNIAAYANVADSTREVVDWIKRRQAEGKFPANLDTITTTDQYAQLLKNAGYYGDTVSNYSRGLRNFYVDNPGWAAASGSTFLLLLAVGAYFFFKRRR